MKQERVPSGPSLFSSGSDIYTYVMQSRYVSGLTRVLASLKWRRGLRAGVAVGLSLAVCYRLHHPAGWVALGALQIILVDNGGPYLSRLSNISSVLLLGSIGVLLGSLAGAHLALAMSLTFAFCFALTLARAISQPLASSSVINLVNYIVAFGSHIHTAHAATASTVDFLLGGLWAASLSMVLWPIDPFRPARLAVAEVYAALAGLAELVPASGSPEGQGLLYSAISRMRSAIEEAGLTLTTAPARMATRTHRARSLTVLNEGADLLLERLLRVAELAAAAQVEAPLVSQQTYGAARNGAARGEMRSEGAQELTSALIQISGWITPVLREIEAGLRSRPADRGAAFEPGGARWNALHSSYPALPSGPDSAALERVRPVLQTSLEDSLLGLEIAMEAVRAIWSGREPVRSTAPLIRGANLREARAAEGSRPALWVDALRSNFTVQSVTLRHALRLALVVTIDVMLLHLSRIVHGYWMPMTSIIVLQPYTGETVRRSGQRIAGTVAGAVLAALLAAALPSQIGLMIAISVGAALTLAVYAVDYAWYCFFLTPTIVLLVLPRLRDWHFAAVRVGMTAIGALIAILAMLLLWPERESLQLPRLLGRAAAAEADYLRATLAFWQRTARSSPEERLAAERGLLAPARRNCGLAANDAEETLDHALVEHAIPLNPARRRTERLNTLSLTFTTYIRRLTQTITLLAAAGVGETEDRRLVSAFAMRLDGVAKILQGEHAESYRPFTNPAAAAKAHHSLAAAQLPRMLRQVEVLEHTAAELGGLIRE